MSRWYVLLILVWSGSMACSSIDSATPKPDAGPTPRFAIDAGVADGADGVDGAVDAGTTPVADAAVYDGGHVDAAVPDASVVPDAGPANRDCGAFAAAGMDVCEATPTECRIVFNNREGCAAACAVGGLECVASSPNQDDVDPPICAPHPTMPPLDCAETGHVSDYCVCRSPSTPPPPPPPPPGPAGCRAETFTPSGTTNVSRTIVITRPGIYDYNGVLHRWTGGGSCNQTENQPYILRIASSDVTVRNFFYENAPDGIHIGTSSDGQGHSSGRTITNIVLENVVGRACEDALTTQFGVRNVTIRDSMFLPNNNTNYRDKLLQLNFGDVTVERTTFYGGGSSLCMMFKGGQSIYVRDSCFNDCDRAINGSTINGIVGRISTNRSDLLSERNEGHHPARARTFWDPWKFFTGEGNVHMVSVQDQIFDNARTDMDQGATLTVR